MEKSVLHELRPSFKERNDVLYLFLALMSVSDRWKRLVEAQTRAARSVGLAASPLSEAELRSSRGLRFCLLGMISLSDHLHALIEGASQTSHSDLSESASPQPWGNLRELLR